MDFTQIKGFLDWLCDAEREGAAVAAGKRRRCFSPIKHLQERKARLLHGDRWCWLKGRQEGQN